MNGIESLQKRIDEETQAEVDGIIFSAQQERDAILNQAQADADEIRKKQKARADRLVHEQELEAKATQRLEQKRVLLREKQAYLQETLQMAEDALNQLSPEERQKLYSKWLRGADMPKGEMIISRQDQAWLPDFLAKEFPDLQVTISDEPSCGGFLLREKNVMADFRFERVLRNQEEVYLRQIAGILYKDSSVEEA